MAMQPFALIVADKDYSKAREAVLGFCPFDAAGAGECMAGFIEALLILSQYIDHGLVASWGNLHMMPDGWLEFDLAYDLPMAQADRARLEEIGWQDKNGLWGIELI